MIAETMTAGYMSALLILRFRSKLFCMFAPISFRLDESVPDSSPARTMATTSGAKVFGYSAKPDESVPPWLIVASRPSIMRASASLSGLAALNLERTVERKPGREHACQVVHEDGLVMEAARARRERS